MEGEAQQKPSPWQMALTILSSLVLGIGFFVLLPTFLIGFVTGVKHAAMQSTNLFAGLIPNVHYILPNLLEGLLRVLFLVGYILLIGRNAELRRLFEYHGAEHKVVNSWEDAPELSLEHAKQYSRIHPRCGTSFLFLFFIVGIIVHALIGWPENPIVRMVSRLILIPIIAGIAYELIRLSGRFRNSRLLRVLIWPGLLLQRLTTAEPSDEQIAVALHSMRSVLEEEGELPRTTEPAPEKPSSAEPAATS